MRKNIIDPFNWFSILISKTCLLKHFLSVQQFKIVGELEAKPNFHVCNINAVLFLKNSVLKMHLDCINAPVQSREAVKF